MASLYFKSVKNLQNQGLCFSIALCKRMQLYFLFIFYLNMRTSSFEVLHVFDVYWIASKNLEFKDEVFPLLLFFSFCHQPFSLRKDTATVCDQQCQQCQQCQRRYFFLFFFSLCQGEILFSDGPCRKMIRRCKSLDQKK